MREKNARCNFSVKEYERNFEMEAGSLNVIEGGDSALVYTICNFEGKSLCCKTVESLTKCRSCLGDKYILMEPLAALRLPI